MNYVVVTNSRGNGTYQVAFTVDEDANEKLSEAAIAGIVIGVVLAVLVIFAVAFFLFKKKKGKKSKRINPVPEPRSNVPDQEGGRDNPAQENE